MSLQRRVAIIIGLAVLAVWLPILVAGLWSLRSRGRFGDSEDLIVTGAYRLVRHPLYAGLSFSLVGLGLLSGSWKTVGGGLAWLLVTQLWSIHEERDLARQFGSVYAEYRRTTPRVVPSWRAAILCSGSTSSSSARE